MLKSFIYGLGIMLSFTLMSQGQLSTSDKDHIIEKVSKHLDKHYILKKEGANMATILKQRNKDGAYNHITDKEEFAEIITSDMHSVFEDKHLALVNKSWAQQKRDSIESSKLDINHHVLETRLLNDGLGYLKIASFTFKPAHWDKAMKSLENCEKLIIDIRNDGGGSGKLENHAISYFLEKNVHFSTAYNRKGKAIKNVSGSVKGKRRTEIPLYILIDKNTFSAAEGFAYQLQSQGRATVIGELSSGGAHPKRNVHINDSYYLSLPVLRVENMNTHSDWEGTGVKPDKSVKPEVALDEAIKEAKGN
jgi:hypothetical protein